MLKGIAKSHRRTEKGETPLARGIQEGFLEEMAFELVLKRKHNLIFQRGRQFSRGRERESMSRSRKVSEQEQVMLAVCTGR